MDVARRLPNLEGYMMDDFFNLEEGQSEQAAGALTAKQLAGLRAKLATVGRPFDLWVVFYDNQLHFPVADATWNLRRSNGRGTGSRRSAVKRYEEWHASGWDSGHKRDAAATRGL